MTETKATYHTAAAYSRHRRPGVCPTCQQVGCEGEIADYIRDPMAFRRAEIILPSGTPWGEVIDQPLLDVLEPLDRLDPATGHWIGATTGERFDHPDPLIAASEALRVLVAERDWELTVRRDVAEQIAGLVARNPRLQATVTVTDDGFRCASTGGVITIKQEPVPA